MLQNILDWIDEAANGLIRLTYLLAGVTAVAVYFGAGNLPPQVETPLNAALPWLVAFSVETQAYLSARKLSKAWHTLQATALEDYQKEQATREARTQLTILSVLVLFSVWNQLNYLVTTWHPHTAFGLPIWLDYTIRAVAPPLFFMVSAFLAPQAQTIGERMDAESHKTLGQFLRVLGRQRKAAMKKLSERNVDMSEAVHAVAQAANEKRAGQMIAAVQSAIVRLAEDEAVAPAPLQAAKVVSASVQPDDETPEQRSRRFWQMHMSAAELARKSQVSVRTARRHIRKFQAEHPDVTFLSARRA